MNDGSDDIAMSNIITELASSVKVLIFNIGKNESTMMVKACHPMNSVRKPFEVNKLNLNFKIKMKLNKILI